MHIDYTSTSAEQRNAFLLYCDFRRAEICISKYTATSAELRRANLIIVPFLQSSDKHIWLYCDIRRAAICISDNTATSADEKRDMRFYYTAIFRRAGICISEYTATSAELRKANLIILRFPQSNDKHIWLLYSDFRRAAMVLLWVWWQGGIPLPIGGAFLVSDGGAPSSRCFSLKIRAHV